MRHRGSRGTPETSRVILGKTFGGISGRTSRQRREIPTGALGGTHRGMPCRTNRGILSLNLEEFPEELREEITETTSGISK